MLRDSGAEAFEQIVPQLNRQLERLRQRHENSSQLPVFGHENEVFAIQELGHSISKLPHSRYLHFSKFMPNLDLCQ